MELSWLEDFVTLATTGNFSRAAELRNITQPAFSRRVRLLEEWVGAPLFDRSGPRVGLTAAGQAFQRDADGLIRRMLELRDAAREAHGREVGRLRIAATHALSFTFFPRWMGAMEGEGAAGVVSLVSDSMAACEDLLIQGQVHFLLCHYHDLAPGRLDNAGFRSVTVGQDMLVPYSAADGAGEPLWRLDGDERVPLLAYTAESGLGRIWAAQGFAGDRDRFDGMFSAHLAATLLGMAREGRGIAWLPESLVADPVAAGSLVVAGGPQWHVPLSIRVVRPASRQTASAEAFWDRMTRDPHASSNSNESERIA
ncbi:LysR family transcriptional regulator [Sphingobium aquiterrae]|uniref:LysR family transcriptional regulator n=1 Tax=Sphingobium aquiterrae TaxID=2038656 RepID=UPI0030167738